eukprot:GHVS01053348.1.p1 GENE.GHVS01053348.1~~GHVS01053348.1.p1  ORF type:complete len:447 (-),score=76.78 GHVS01053348.1:1520-2830(-)
MSLSRVLSSSNRRLPLSLQSHRRFPPPHSFSSIPSSLSCSSLFSRPSPSTLCQQRRNVSILSSKEVFSKAKDFIPLEGTDFVEIYCSNAKQSAHWYCSVFGFQPVAYAGLETGLKDRTSYVVGQGNIRLVLTSSLVADGDIADHVKLHGDGVRFVSLRCPDAGKAHKEATSRGAKSFMEPRELKDDDGVVVMSGIHTYGDTIHLFVERKNYSGQFLPGFVPWAGPGSRKFTPVGLKHVDHMVGNVEVGQMNRWCKFYEDIFGMVNFVSFDDTDISTEYTALMSKVMSNGTGYVKYPINEPADGKKKSQIEEYLDFYRSAGVQHIAVATDDIVKTVAELKNRGCEFLFVPGSYYDDLRQRCGDIDEEVAQLRELGILVDRDPEGYLLQIFTKPVGDRPTLFFEIIQRKGAQSFGKGNFKALFESIEAEQGKRGTLEK